MRRIDLVGVDEIADGEMKMVWVDGTDQVRVINNGGEFTARSGDTVVKGEFTSKTKAEGTLKSVSSSFDPISYRTVTCRSGKVGWTAKH